LGFNSALTAQIMIKRTRRVAPADLHALSRIGNNLNQIAKVCNTTGESRRAQGIEIYLDELRPLLKRYRGRIPKGFCRHRGPVARCDATRPAARGRGATRCGG
jgi:hypothetical protein